jgi:hypothetical protein
MKQLLAILTLTVTALGKQSAPISHYMQDTGLLYLESVESLTIACGQTSTADSDCLSEWHTRMGGVEDRILIHMEKTQANKQYFDLLKTAKWMRENYATGDKDQQHEWEPKYAKCSAYVHTVALEGELFDSSACQWTCEEESSGVFAIIAPMHKRLTGSLISQNGQQTYSILLDLELDHIRVDEGSERPRLKLVERTAIPGQKMPPKGNYTLQPHEYHPEPTQVRIDERGHMVAGSLWT